MVFQCLQKEYFISSTTKRFCLQLKRFISTIDVKEILHVLFIKICENVLNNYFGINIKKLVQHKNFTRISVLDDEKF